MAGVLLSISSLVGVVPAADCNINGVDDRVDIESGASEDCNGDGVPDECQTGPFELALGARAFPLPDVAQGAVAADLDGDGVDDLATVHAGEGGVVGVLRGRGDGLFEEAARVAAPGSLRAVDTVDLDADGDIDLVTAAADAVHVLENRDGELVLRTTLAVPRSVRALIAADVSGDGRPDLLAANGTLDALLVLVQEDGGAFTAPRSVAAGDAPAAAAAADLDGDGDIDVAVANRLSLDVSVVLNSGAGQLAEATRLEAPGNGPFAILTRDVTGDGLADIAAASTDGGVTLWRSAGDGAFEPPDVLGVAAGLLAAADLDGDGDLELLVGDEQTNAVLALANLGEGRFAAAVPLTTHLSRRLISPGDFDGDGDIDLALTGLGSDRAGVLWNREHGRSGLALLAGTAVVGVRPHGIGIGDLDADGHPEVVTADGHFDRLTVFRGTADGRLVDPVIYQVSNAGHLNDAEVVDLDADGDRDVVVVDQDASFLRIFDNPGHGRLPPPRSERTSGRPWTVTAADLDGDGDPDLAVAARGAGAIDVFVNDGSGGFSDRASYPVGVEPVRVRAGDVDGDGDPDLVAANSGSGSVSVLANDGEARFADAVHLAVPGSPLGIALGDFDGDGDVDIATSNTERIAVSLNRGDGSFTAGAVHAVDFFADTIEAVDVDGDTRLDMVTSNGDSNSVTVFLGRGDGTFVEQLQSFVGQQPLAVAAADIDLDGDIDLVTPNRGSHDVTVLLNQATPPSFPGTHLEEICTELDFFRVSVAVRSEEVERVCKFVLPATDDPDLLPPVFQNTARFPLHQQFLALAFPERFPGLTTEEYDRLVSGRETRTYFAGAVSRFRAALGDGGATGTAYGFGIASDAPPDLDEARRVHATLTEVFRLGPLGYRPEGAAATLAALEWRDPGFPIFVDAAGSRAAYRPYTLAVGFGRVRILDEAGLETAAARGDISFQNVLVLAFAARDVEGGFAGIVTAELQGELSHLAVRTARRNTPNAYVANAVEAFRPFEGKLVRLEVAEESYSVREASLEEAEAFWAAVRPRIEGAPALDETYRRLADLDEIADLDAAEPDVAQESRFGGKATNLARLGRVLAGSPYERFREDGFAIPAAYSLEFLRTNSIPSAFDDAREVTYEEHLRELVRSDEFQGDPAFRFARLEAFREFARENGVVSPALVLRVAARIDAVFGGTDRPVRFRSSSNLEDLLEFNGAGLYESTTGCAADSFDADDGGPSRCDSRSTDERTIERALKKVWTSLWTFRAVEERSFFGLSHEQAGMAVLVTRAFQDEAANGVAFTGNLANPLDRRYVVTVQLGEESVVHPDPGVLPEKDLLEVAGGEVVRIIRPARGSTLVPPGEWILSDAQLLELGGLMAFLDARYPIELGAHDRDRVLLDIEFKVDGGGALAVKQIRPFLLTASAPPAPIFELVIPEGTVACGVFAPAGTDRGPREEYELKSTAHLRSGRIELKTAVESFTGDLIEDVVLGPELQQAEPRSRGLFSVARFPANGGVAGYRFSYEQEFELPDGRTLTLMLRLPGELRARGDEPLDPPLVVDGPALTTTVGKEILVGRLEGVDAVRYGSCDHRPLTPWEVTAELEDGTRLVLEERFLPPENPAETGPARLARADVVIGGERRVISSYRNLVYSAFRHNTAVRYWVVFDAPVDAPGVAGVRAVELAAPDELAGSGPAASYLDDRFEVLARLGVASFSRRSIPDRPEPRFRRGDVDGRRGVNLTDAVVVLNYLFLGGPAPACIEAADVDDSGTVTLTDPVRTLDYAFRGGPPPAAPFEECGPDPTPDGLSCEEAPCP